MTTFENLLSWIIHIDTYLFSFVLLYGKWTYLLLFTIIFFETGVVITPFLPGDSLLFVSGSIAAQPLSALNIILLFLLLMLASTLGNQLNYLIGRFTGGRLLQFKRIKVINKKHLQRTEQFYGKYGGLTIIIARFLPIIRTLAPFVAGMASMGYYQFFIYNIIGAILWIGGLLTFGYYFGSLTIVKENFSLVIYSIIAISLAPLLLSVLRRINFTMIRAKKDHI